MPGDDEEDIVMTSTQCPLLNTTCPLSGKPLTELADPVRRYNGCLDFFVFCYNSTRISCFVRMICLSSPMLDVYVGCVLNVVIKRVYYFVFCVELNTFCA